MEHLHLVELVAADHAALISTVGTGLTTEAGRVSEELLGQGLLAEVQKLKDMGYHRNMVSMQGLGYKEILDYLDGKCSLEEAIYIIKRETRHFAKRQLTWFRREREICWMDKSAYNYEERAVLDAMCRILNTKGIIKE
ncbi:MAG: hypothetical protein IJ419_15060 [Agathobacter sp.]|nr:hypothetical protein [Agathobacter sp.]